MLNRRSKMKSYSIEILKGSWGFHAVVVDGEHRAATRRIMKTKRGALRQAAALIRELEQAKPAD